MAQSNAPAAVRRQIKEAARQQAAVQAGQDPFNGQPPPRQAPPAAPQGGIQPVPEFVVVGDPIPPGYQVVDLTVPQNQPAPVATPAPRQGPQWTPASQQSQQPQFTAAPDVPPPGAQPVADPADQRYKVLQGKYNAEQRAARERIAALEAQVNTLIVHRAPAPPPAITAPTVPSTPRERALAAGFTEKEIEEYGQDLVDMMVRTANNIAAPAINSLRAEQQRLAGTVQNTVQTARRTAEELFWDTLSDKVPNYAEINQSQEWLDWLGQREVFSGRTRNEGLQNAFQASDALRVAEIMKTFLAEDERTRSTAGGPRIDPATLVAPGTPVSSAPAPAGTNVANSEIITEAEVREHYAAVRRGHLKGKRKEEAEARINRALAEGRIKPEHNDAYLINSR